MIADTLRIPFADHMLVPVPDGVAPERVAAASDNLADAWRSIVPALAERVGGRVLVLGGGAKSIGLYAAGLAAIDRVAQSSRGRRFKDLLPGEQDDILSRFESGNVQGFDEAAAFFGVVRAHTLQGTFCDPYYGGNAGFVGWDLIGYPGVRTLVTPDEQRLGADVPFNHKSAYDYEMFTKAVASAAPIGAIAHGD